MKRPEANEYNPYFKKYIDLVKQDNVLKALKDQVMDIQALVSGIPEDKEEYAYAEGKWTIKEVLGHIIDTERIMSYRALRFARKDKTELNSFDENLFVANAKFNKQSLYNLAHEFAIVREANLALWKQFEEEEMSQTGIANKNEMSVRAILFMIAGHTTHHMNVIRINYLLD
ncbi:MAG: hypothetical protein JWP12_3265 [Bacteroidetes bacterium]|nr:hypothetical protein [Bacteroidota bacterium]